MNWISKYFYFFKESLKEATYQASAFNDAIEDFQRQVYPEEMPFLIKSKPKLNYSFFNIDGKYPVWVSEISPGLYKLAKKCI